MPESQNPNQNLHRRPDQARATGNPAAWYQLIRIGPLGPLGLCAIAVGFIALLISGRLRMLYPMPRTVIASPRSEAQERRATQRAEAEREANTSPGKETDGPRTPPAGSGRGFKTPPDR